MDYDEAIGGITHQCYRLSGLRFNPNAIIRSGMTFCEDRKNRKHDNPALAQFSSLWLCQDCPGPVPIGTPTQNTPVHVSRKTRRIVVRNHRCCKCGETNPELFDRGHSRKCRACISEDTTKIIKLVCLECGGPCTFKEGSNADRKRLGLCGVCFDQYRYRIRQQDERDRIRGEDRVRCLRCGEFIRHSGTGWQKRIIKKMCKKCEDEQRKWAKKRGGVIADIDGKPVMMFPKRTKQKEVVPLA